MSILSDILFDFKKIVFTNRCKLCGEVIEINEEFCHDCKNISVIDGDICDCCGCKKEDCTCDKNKNEYKRIIAPYYYENSVITAVHRFKTNNMPYLAEYFGTKMTECLFNNYSDVNFDAICFVPMRQFHERTRGFNQSYLLAKRVSQLTSIPVLDIMKKVRYTGVQHNKSAMQRKADVFGSYDVINKCKNGFLNGKTILLIDDVKTTGSTLNECAKMLKIYGAESVYCLTFSIRKKN